jgi:recombinational DNA repair protein RecR
MAYPPALQTVVDELGRFPGVGPKSAQRIAFWLMRQPSEDVARLAQALDEMKTKLAGSVRSAPTTGATRRSFAWWRTRPT